MERKLAQERGNHERLLSHYESLEAPQRRDDRASSSHQVDAARKSPQADLRFREEIYAAQKSVKSAEIKAEFTQSKLNEHLQEARNLENKMWHANTQQQELAENVTKLTFMHVIQALH